MSKERGGERGEVRHCEPGKPHAASKWRARRRNIFLSSKAMELSDTFKQAARKKIKKKTVQGTGLRVLVRGGERRAGRSRDEKEGREAEHEDGAQAGKSETSGAAYIV